MLPERCFSLQVGMALRAVLLLLFSVGEAGSFPWEGNAFPKVDAAYSPESVRGYKPLLQFARGNPFATLDARNL
jgi:hypothetical protein